MVRILTHFFPAPKVPRVCGYAGPNFINPRQGAERTYEASQQRIDPLGWLCKLVSFKATTHATEVPTIT